MPTKVSVNQRTVVSKKSTGMAIAFPDVCKTPSPAGPVPIPYPNVAQSSDSAKTTKKVKCDGEGVCVKGSNFSMSTGDEAGSAQGVASNKIKGKAEFQNFAMDVKFEGKTVARLGDPMTQNLGGSANTATPGEVQAPAPVMGTGGDDEACKRLEKKHVPEDQVGDVAEECGMPREHAQSMREACSDMDTTATVRSTNPDCMDKIRAGNPAKGCDVKNKTISEKSLGRAPNGADPDVMAKVDEHGLRGYVGDYAEDGSLRGVLTRNADGTPGSVPLGDIPPPPSNGYTGDYDLHDVFAPDGGRVSPTPVGPNREGFTIAGMNEAIGRGTPGDPMSDMVRHGPQSNYWEWANQTGNLPAKADLCLPDVSPGEPLLVFDQNGEVYKLESEEELRDLYACKGAEVPETWDWDEAQWKKAVAEGKVDGMPSKFAK